MRIRSLDHLVLTVSDIAATVRFYESLGMRREVFGDERVALRVGNQKMNLDQVAKLLSERGIPVELGPIARTGATSALVSLYIRDPDGNLVELSQPVKQDD